VVVVYAAKEGKTRIDVFNVELTLLSARKIAGTLAAFDIDAQDAVDDVIVCVFRDGRAIALRVFGLEDLGSGVVGPGVVAVALARAKSLYVLRDDGVVAHAQLA
jgi:hypothetical protein